MSDAASHVSDADSQATIALTERPIHYTTWCAEDHLACPCGMHQLYRNEITLPENIIIAMQHQANGPYHAPFETRGGECSGCMIGIGGRETVLACCASAKVEPQLAPSSGRMEAQRTCRCRSSCRRTSCTV